ncbi:hypothetical protein [Micromonospora carbonacea]|uniref:hypothetical protein n=1 Tax=Micromonospora carbonacea TaxID=47853 RepID=UPI003D73911A
MFGNLRRVALAVLALAGFAVVAATPADATSRSTGPKPTVVLVHGAFADSSGWNGVMQRLRKDGYPGTGGE